VPDASAEQNCRPGNSPKDVQPADLDAVDREILTVLHGDARITNSALAEAVGIAPSTCHGRVRRLVDLGVIRGFYTDVDPVAVGLPLQAMISVNRVLGVPANRSAHDAMHDRDPMTPYSCPQGFCGTCKVKVLAGQVDHRGRTVGGDEMLVCVSRAKGGRVVIDA
jgi:ferredoxin